MSSVCDLIEILDGAVSAEEDYEIRVSHPRSEVICTVYLNTGRYFFIEINMIEMKYMEYDLLNDTICQWYSEYKGE